MNFSKLSKLPMILSVMPKEKGNSHNYDRQRKLKEAREEAER